MLLSRPLDVKDKLHSPQTTHDSHQYHYCPKTAHHGQIGEDIVPWLSPCAPHHRHTGLHPGDDPSPYNCTHHTSWLDISHRHCALDPFRTARSGERRRQRQAHAAMDEVRRSLAGHVLRICFGPDVCILIRLGCNIAKRRSTSLTIRESISGGSQWRDIRLYGAVACPKSCCALIARCR